MNSELKFGMNIHNCGYDSYPLEYLEENIDACKELGMDIIRFNQSSLEADAIEEVKSVSRLCHKRDMKLMLVVDTTSYTRIDSLHEIETEMAKYYKELSSSYKDAVDVYQIYNEMDVRCMGGSIANIFLTPADGKEKGEYDYILWDKSIAAVKGALKGMKEGYPEGKTCINFAWWHTALIYELYRKGCRWDITGIDWYSDCEEVSSIELLMNDVVKNIPDTDIMICEVNYWMNLHRRYPEERKQALKKAEERYALQAEWVPEFIDKLLKCNNPGLKAVIFYELLDEPNFEEDRGDYIGESHFGFIECDRHSGNRLKKPAFYSLKDKIGRIKSNTLFYKSLMKND